MGCGKEYTADLEDIEGMDDLIGIAPAVDFKQGMVVGCYDNLTKVEKKLYREVVKVIKDTYMPRATLGIPRQSIIKSSLTRIYQDAHKCVPATMETRGLLIHQEGLGGSVTMYYME